MDKTSGEFRVHALNAARKPSMCRLFFLLVLKGSLFSLVLLSSCAAPQLPPAPPKYVHEGERAPERSVNSLWSDTASLYEDFKAKRLNDLVTINVIENISGSGKADTSATRKSALDAKVEDFFGAPINQSTNNFWGNGHSLTPTLKGSMNNDFQGTGATTREGKLIGTITAKVVEVMPNGNLFIESRKEITINNEKQVLILSGMIRPVDISPDNTILSSKVADAQVFFVGDGVLQDKQKPGWLMKIMDKVWPF
jgi:flagellar L-ring protein FlgH